MRQTRPLLFNFVSITKIKVILQSIHNDRYTIDRYDFYTIIIWKFNFIFARKHINICFNDIKQTLWKLRKKLDINSLLYKATNFLEHKKVNVSIWFLSLRVIYCFIFSDLWPCKIFYNGQTPFYSALYVKLYCIYNNKQVSQILRKKEWNKISMNCWNIAFKWVRFIKQMLV